MTEWIYCSEKLPPYGKRVFLSVDGEKWQGEKINAGPATVLGKRMFTDESGEHYRDNGPDIDGVYAWMPFPEPAVLP